MKPPKNPSGLGSTSSRHQPKLCGGDLELGNFVAGVSRLYGTGYEASRALLGEFEGVSSNTVSGWNSATYGAYASNSGANSQDWGRKFLANGGCSYIDLNHLEICLPEVLSARDHLAYTHALYRLAQRAADAVNARLPEGQHLHVLANNSDGLDHSYGSHINVLLHREAWRDIFDRRPVFQGFLAAYQISSVVFTGLGKVGSENGAPPVNYQLSQRADFVETICAVQTTYRRPIVNSRDEPLCGDSHLAASDPATSEMARLHCIFYDQNLCHVSGFLKIGVLQIILTMIEAHCVSPALMVDDLVEATTLISHDPSLQQRVLLASGLKVTAVELQLKFCEEARRFVEDGRCKGIVPDADFILELWSETLEKLHQGNLASLAGRLDWVLKLSMLHQAMQTQGIDDWSSPVVRHLDQMYSSLDPKTGPFWSYQKSGVVDDLPIDELITQCLTETPDNTRAWTRGKLLALSGGAAQVDGVDWDWVRFRLRGSGRYSAAEVFTVPLANPLRWTREEASRFFPPSHDIRDTLEAMSAVKSQPHSVYQYSAYGSGVNAAAGRAGGTYSR